MSDQLQRTLQYLGQRAAPAPLARKSKARIAEKAPDVRKRKQGAGRKVAAAKPADARRAGINGPQLGSKAVVRLAEKLAVDEGVVLEVSNITARTFHRRQSQDQPLSALEADRVLRIARVASEAERVFRSEEKSRRWLTTHNIVLSAQPLQLLATDAGARAVEAELVRIDWGDFG